MINTRSPTAASAVPRLIAVVVLPTPPFWLAMARTRGFLCGCAAMAGVRPGDTTISTVSAESAMAGHPFPCERAALTFAVEPLQLPNDHNAAVRTRLTRNERGLDVPIYRCCGPLDLYISPLGKQGKRGCFQQGRNIG